MKARVAVLSGERGSNMKALVERGRKEDSSFEVVVVFFPKPCKSQKWCLEQGIPARDWESIKERESDGIYDQILSLMAAYKTNIICCAGWMRMIPDKDWIIPREDRNDDDVKILNIHPSLLPALKGLNTHQRAIDEKHEYHGCSVHLVSDEIDGGEVLGQARTLVQPFDCAKSLGERVLALEHELYPRVVNDFAAKLLSGGNDWGIFEDLRRSVEKYREEGGRH